jgi:hypothetical protein
MFTVGKNRSHREAPKPLPARSQPNTSNLEAFLFSDIGIQQNEMPLTILSLLARAGLDPWVEAERLSHMSKPEAISSMVARISRAPASCRRHADVRELAKRLVARLPSHETTKLPDITGCGTGYEGIPMIALMVLFYAILMLGLLAFVLEKG